MVINSLLFSSSNDYNGYNDFIAKEDFMKNSWYDSFEMYALTKSHGAHRL